MEIDTYRTVGKIHREIQDEIKKYVNPGTKLIDIAKFVESQIRDRELNQLNDGIAFPVGLSLNNVAAHYTPNNNSLEVYRAEDILKVDFGVHIEGCIVDGAISITHNPELKKLVDISIKTTELAIQNSGPNKSLSNIGKIIEDYIMEHDVMINSKMYNVKSFRDLCGHQISQYKIHSGKAVPNINVIYPYQMKMGEIYAIEPFLTTGRGKHFYNNNYNMVNHFMFDYKKYKDLESAKKHGFSQGLKQSDINFLEYLYYNFRTLAFCPRWIESSYESNNKQFRNLIKKGIITDYPPICDCKGSYVAQHEKTIYITDNGVEVLN